MEPHFLMCFAPIEIPPPNTAKSSPKQHTKPHFTLRRTISYLFVDCHIFAAELRCVKVEAQVRIVLSSASWHNNQQYQRH
mmetsp:Transcript_16845/g.35618  ORF Transcript_16845/g.35618 Transcript_16845/m.35618 type:complete len:80 (+) Transcript_16845:17-256(+)